MNKILIIVTASLRYKLTFEMLSDRLLDSLFDTVFRFSRKLLNI